MLLMLQLSENSKNMGVYCVVSFREICNVLIIMHNIDLCHLKKIAA